MESQSIDDELFIIHERLNRDVSAMGNRPLPAEPVSNQRENLNGMGQGPSQAVSGVSSGSEDDSIQVLNAIRPQYAARSQLAGNVADPNRPQYAARPQLAGNVADPNRRVRRRVECALCDKTPRMLKALNRRMGAAICGHLFCNRCMAFMFINNWRICAICRIRLDNEDYHRVYF